MIHHVEVQVLVLLLVAALVAMGARRLRLPYTLALVLTGLVLGFIHIEALSGLHLNADVLLLLFLPALLFEAAFHIDLSGLRKNLAPILTLAGPGVLVTVALTATLLHYALAATGIAPSFGWSHALLFASVIAATDPISVLALFKELGVARRLYMLVEGESLLNDGVAVVVFVIVSAVLGVGAHGEADLDGVGAIASYALKTFLWMSGGGVVIGLMVGGAVSALTAQVDDHLVEVTLTTLVAYGSFLLAEQIHASGVLSTVTAGVVMGSVGKKHGMSVTTRVAVEDFWEYMGFLANSFIFLLVGLELAPGDIARQSALIGLGFAVTVLARAVVIYGTVPLVNRISEHIPLAWRHVMVWGGLRGSLSMVLVLTLPGDFPGRGVLVTLVFGVVAGSLFVQGLTVGPLVRWLRVRGGATGDRARYEAGRARAMAARKARDAVARLIHDGALGPLAAMRLEAWYDQRRLAAEALAEEAGGENRYQDELHAALRELADVEREAVRHAVATAQIPPELGFELSAELNHRIVELDEAAHAGDAELRTALDALLAERPVDEG